MWKLDTVKVSDTERRAAVAVTKDRIADVFAKHVERFGYRKTTLDEVARELHISKKTLYVHFEGKREIYAYLVERIAVQARRDMAAAVAALPTNAEKLMALVDMVLRQSRAHILETSAADWQQEYAVAADAFTSAYGSLMRELVEAGMGAGEFAVRDAELTERMLKAMILEYALMVREDPTYDRDAELKAGIGRYLG
jgi:AcrR family transcriptional regulator